MAFPEAAQAASLSLPTPLDRTIEGFQQNIASSLPAIDTLADEDLAVVIRTYAGIIEPNFLAWMLQTWRLCRSEVAVEACRDNLICEINDNHPRMLRNFAAAVPLSVVGGPRVATAQEWASHATRVIANAVHRSGLEGLLVMACLENASLAFIPWMEQAAQRLGVKDLTYTQVHGVEDIRHANQFLEAVESEAGLLQLSLEHVGLRSIIESVEILLRRIFRAHQVQV